VLNILATVVALSMFMFIPSVKYLCVCFVKVIMIEPCSVYFSITATYLSVFVFFHVSVCSLSIPCILESTALCVGVKTLYNVD